jgi:putative transposase
VCKHFTKSGYQCSQVNDGLVKDWREYLDEQIAGSEDMDTVRRSTRIGRPAGDVYFVNKIEKLTGRLLQKQKPGPKKKQKC